MAACGFAGLLHACRPQLTVPGCRLDRASFVPFALASKACTAAVQPSLGAIRAARSLQGRLVLFGGGSPALSTVSACLLDPGRLLELLEIPGVEPQDVGAWETLARRALACCPASCAHWAFTRCWAGTATSAGCSRA